MIDLRFPMADLRMKGSTPRRGVPIVRYSQRASHSALGNRQSAMRTAFTLTELLITISLIVLLIAIAVPAFSFLTGGRSLEAARNVIAPALGQARANAIGVQKVRGAVFFREAATDRAAIVLVEQKVPLVWTDTASYTIGDWVYVPPVTSGINAFYVCKTNHTATTTNKPGSAGGSANWDATSGAINSAINNGNIVLDVVPGSDRALLPVGVGVLGVTDGGYKMGQPGTVLFDEYGMLTIRSFAVSSVSLLGKQLGMTGDDVDVSQIGLVIFDRQGFENAPDADDYVNDNATPLLINRYNGTIVKGE